MFYRDGVKPLAAAFALLVAAAGWYYALYARETAGVQGEAASRLNRQRLLLRRLGGVVMMGLAVCFFAGFWTVNWEPPTDAFYWIWVAVAAQLGVIVILALVDVRLTWKLQKVQRKGISVE